MDEPASASRRVPAPDPRDALRPGERAVALPPPADAALRFIGRIRTPFATRADCPRQGDSAAGPDCRIELAAPWHAALAGLEGYARVEVLYWLDRARRDLVVQSPGDGGPRGTFSLRSPVRPNPIGTALVRLLAVEPGALVVRGLDCIDGTPLLDLKPDRCAFTPLAAAKDGTA